jgi:histidinol phosphatase-like enzyme
VFLGRDEVIDRMAPEERYIRSREKMAFPPRVVEAATWLIQAGLCVIVVSKQRPVYKGLLP